MRRQEGFGVLELLISLSMLVGIGFMVMQLQTTILNESRKIKNQFEIAQMVNEIYRDFKKGYVCEELIGLDARSSEDGAIQLIEHDYDFENASYQMDRIELKELNESAYLRVRFKRKNNNQKVIQEIFRDIRLNVQLNNGVIEECFNLEENVYKTIRAKACNGNDGARVINVDGEPRCVRNVPSLIQCDPQKGFYTKFIIEDNKYVPICELTGVDESSTCPRGFRLTGFNEDGTSRCVSAKDNIFDDFEAGTCDMGASEDCSFDFQLKVSDNGKFMFECINQTCESEEGSTEPCAFNPMIPSDHVCCSDRPGPGCSFDDPLGDGTPTTTTTTRRVR